MKITKVTRVEIDGKEVEIKKCPCCGGEAELKVNTEKDVITHWGAYIKCKSCGLRTSFLEVDGYMMFSYERENKLEELVKLSLETWNRRTM